MNKGLFTVVLLSLTLDKKNNQSSSVRSRQGNSNSRDKMFCKGLCETLNLTSTFSPLGW